MSLRKRIAAGVAATAVFAGAGIAFAAWTSEAEGTGSASSIEDLTSAITPVVGTADLYPGASSTIRVTINNPNDYPVEVMSISAGSSKATTGGCAADTVRTTGIPAGAEAIEAVSEETLIEPDESLTYELQVHMKATAAEECKTEDFTIVDFGTQSQTTPEPVLTATLRSAATDNNW